MLNGKDAPLGVLCSGSIVFDVLVRPVSDSEWGTTTFVESLEFHVGGNGANTSRVLGALGTPVRLLGTVGRDEQARFVLEQFRGSGVDIRELRTVAQPTAATVVMVGADGQRKFLHRVGASGEAFRSPLEFTPELTEGMRHYHLASLFVLPRLRPHAPAMLAAARAAGLITSIDTNWDPLGRWMEDLGPCLPHVDMLFLNEDEARMLTGSSDPDTAGYALLEAGASIVIIKLGHRGCAVFSEATEVYCPAFEADVKDTTGAGDSFVGGFLAAHLRGFSLNDSARFGNAVAALTVQKIGAFAGIPRFRQVEEWMHSAHVRV